MPKDIRDILKENSRSALELSKDHRAKFEERLQKLHTPRVRNYLILKIAASILIIVSIGYLAITHQPSDGINNSQNSSIVDLGTVSPEMKQIENYYLTAINYEMASLEVNPEAKEVLDQYLEKISELTKAYKQLNIDLSQNGITEKTINALITNLQLRLQLLLELKDTMNEIKTSKTSNNEVTI
ncbi:MAG: hypothetical protein KJO83_06485 [Bacteroidia bacterium]|nr:hypothetical protein [Bacteroidia bacterium]